MRLHLDAQQVLRERIDQHLVVLRAATDQGAHHAGGDGVLQHHVDVRVADAAHEGRALELQAQHGQILDVDREQEDAGTALHDVGSAAVAALQLTLVEGRDRLPQTGQVGIRSARLALHPEVVLLRLRAVALQVVEFAGALEQVRVVRVQPERAMDIALAGDQAHQGGAVASCGLEQGLLAGAVTELDAGHQVADQAIPGGNVRPGADGVHERL